MLGFSQSRSLSLRLSLFPLMLIYNLSRTTIRTNLISPQQYFGYFIIIVASGSFCSFYVIKKPSDQLFFALTCCTQKAGPTHQGLFRHSPLVSMLIPLAIPAVLDADVTMLACTKVVFSQHVLAGRCFRRSCLGNIQPRFSAVG